MEYTYTYEIYSVEKQTTDQAIISARGRIICWKGERTAQQSFNVSFSPDSTSADFIPFESVTTENVVQWVIGQWDVNELATLKATLAQWIENDINRQEETTETVQWTQPE